MRPRPLPVTVAILIALCGVLNALFPWWVNTVQPEEDIPTVVVFVTAVVGVAGLVGAAGLWMLRKWGVWLTVTVAATCHAAVGAKAIPGTASKMLSTKTIMVISFVLIIVLVMLLTWRRSFTAS